ncbi:MAG: GtrA family protein [Bacteroidetes bacterium]|nr:GtrA family protein [Bacteroidota bacterium]
MRAYVKFIASSVISTALDYGITIVLTEVMAVMYVLSSAIGLISGGTANYLINKNWVFGRRGGRDKRAALLYVLVWILNLVMNTLGLYVLTDRVQIDYRISKILTSVVVGALLSYFAQKNVVFRVQRTAL